MTNSIEMKQTSFMGIDAMNEPHLPVLILLDTSGSMNGEPLDQLREGFNGFLTQTATDELAMKRVDVAVMTFSGLGIKTVCEFMPLASAIEMPPLELKAEGNTPLGAAIEAAVEKLRERCRVYDEAGVVKYKPWLFIITDAMATDDLTRAHKIIREREDLGRLKTIAVAVNNADLDVLKSISPRIIKCEAENSFKGIFNWLSDSMSTISSSRVFESPTLPNLPENFRVIPTDWA